MSPNTKRVMTDNAPLHYSLEVSVNFPKCLVIIKLTNLFGDISCIINQVDYRVLYTILQSF